MLDFQSKIIPNSRRTNMAAGRSFLFMVFFTLTQLLSQSVGAESISPESSVVFSGNVKGSEDLSAIGKFGEYLVIGSDEGTGESGTENIIQFLARQSDNQYRVVNEILLFKGNKELGKEMDTEAIAVDGSNIYVIGSHSKKRRKQKSDKSLKRNRKVLEEGQIVREISREVVYKLQIDSELNVLSKTSISLDTVIKKHAALKLYTSIPSKENGVDIEGVAVSDGFVYAGFRGPVFREGHVPILKFKFDDPVNTNELLYVNLDGRGVRDMAKVADGFLILAGPVSEAPVSYRLYHWNGKDVLSGDDQDSQDVGHMTPLGTIQVPLGGKAEGLLVVDESAPNSFELIIIFDGVEGGGGMRYRVPRSP